MVEIFAEGKNLPEAYNNSLSKLVLLGEEVACSDYNTKCLEVGATIHTDNPVDDIESISRFAFCEPTSLETYLNEMLCGSLDWAIAEGKEPYTYHDRMVNYDGINQIKFVVDELKRNPDSRRAVILVRHKNDITFGDPACLQHIQFFIRNNKLDCVATFRSNDAVRAAFMNMLALVELQRYVAKMLEIDVGSYTHRANSYHAYETSIDTLRRMMERYEKSASKSKSFSWKKYTGHDRDYSRWEKVFTW